MEKHHRKIVQVVRRVKWVQRLVAVLEAAAIAFTLFIACLLAATALSGWLSHSATARAAGLWVSIGLPALAGLVWLLRSPYLRQSDTQCALAIERSCGTANNEIVNALQLGGAALATQTQVVATSLVERLVKTVSSGLTYRLALQGVSADTLRRATSTLAVVALVGGALWFTAPGTFAKAWTGLLRPWDEVQGLAQRRPRSRVAPAVGDITLTYHYPLYTGLRSKVVRNSSGDISAIKGTEVEIKAAANVPLRGAVLLLSSGQKAPLQVTADNDAGGAWLSGRVVVVESGTYRFKLLPITGAGLVDDEQHSIRALSDNAPKVEFTAGQDKTEVTERGEVELAYQATDDFGVAKVRLVFQRKSGKKTINLKSFDVARKRWPDTYTWELAGLGLQPGERVDYHIEAEDNDSVGGPNVGRSRTRHIEVASATKRHRRIVELQRQLKRQMLQLLADQLESPPSALAASPNRLLLEQEKTQARRDAALRLMSQVTALMQHDVMANYAYYEAIRNMRTRLLGLSQQRRNILFGLRRIMAKAKPIAGHLAALTTLQGEEIRELENDILFLADLILRQQMDALRHRMEDMLTSQRDIADMLEQLASNPDADLSKQAQQLLEQIRQKLAELMAEMAKMAPKLPKEFANADAQANAAQQQASNDLRQMMEAMKRGDMKAALQAAQRMLNQLSKMIDSMKEATQNYADSRYSEAMRKLAKIHREISELEKRQHEIAKQTNDIKKAAQRRVFSFMKSNLDDFFKKQLQRLAEVETALKALDTSLQDDAAEQYRSMFRSYMQAIQGQGLIFRQMASAKTQARRRKLDQALRKVQAKLTQLSKHINDSPVLRTLNEFLRQLPTALGQTGKLKQTLEAWDVGESLPLAEQLEMLAGQWWRLLHSIATRKRLSADERNRADRASPRLAIAEKRSHEIAQDLRNLMTQLDAMRKNTLTKGETQQLKELSGQQGELRRRLQALQQQTNKAMAKMPFMSLNMGRALRRAGVSMGRAGQKLDTGQTGQALASERDAAAQLGKARKMLEDSQQMLKQGMMGSGMPMPGNLQRSGNSGRPDVRKVEIPSEDAHKVPKRFRQDIIDAMKQGMPQRFKAINREYYRKLLQ